MKIIKLFLLMLLPLPALALENTLTWDAVTDTRVQGYSVYCSTSPDGPWGKVGVIAGISSTTLNVIPCADTGIV